MKTKTIILILLVAIASCKPRNKLNTNEQKLAAQIESEEKEKQETKSEKQVEQSLADTLLPGFQFQEDRRVDPSNPPVLLDVLGTQQNVREFKLSDIASSIQYIKLQTPPDSNLFWVHPKLDLGDFSVFSDDENVFVKWTFGLARFNMNGNFKELIWKNKSGIELGAHGFNFSPGELNGISPPNPVSTFNNNLYIRFTDSRNNQIQFVKQKVQSQQTLNISPNDIEIQSDSIAGNKLFSIKGSVYDRSYETVFGLSKNSWAGIQNTFIAAEKGALITVFSNEGDTLCLFSSAHQVKNRTSPLVADNRPFTWYFKDNLTFLEQYSDTIFRIIPPNKMLPVYVLDFGKDKVSFQEGLNLKADLSQKLLPYSIFETKDYLFIRYSRNSAGPQNLRNNTVKFYNSLFIKSENQFYHFPDQSMRPKNILNDLDGGLPFWPEFVTSEGKMLMMVSGKMLKEHVNSDEFENKEMSEEQRQKQIGMANALNDFDKLVLIVK